MFSVTIWCLSFPTNQNAVFVFERRTFDSQRLSCRLSFQPPFPHASNMKISAKPNTKHETLTQEAADRLGIVL